MPTLGAARPRNSIAFTLVVTVLKQGRMGRGFEFGSQNQPPHLDGLQAIPLAEKRLDKLADAAIGFALP